MMKPTTPQNEEEFGTVGPQYFCNPWDGGGREKWVSERVHNVGKYRDLHFSLIANTPNGPQYFYNA